VIRPLRQLSGTWKVPSMGSQALHVSSLKMCLPANPTPMWRPRLRARTSRIWGRVSVGPGFLMIVVSEWLCLGVQYGYVSTTATEGTT
jgi:hypothetical protein